MPINGDLTLAMRTTRSGLQASQTALNAIANNVANANTPGYSRKVINFENRVLAGVGVGVQVAELTRKVDAHLLGDIRTELSAYHAADVRAGYYDRLQDLFGTPADDSSLVHELADFTAAVESLAADPDALLSQQDVVRQGQDVALGFQQLSDSIQELRRQADAEIAAAVEKADGLLADIAELNAKIVKGKTLSEETVDLEDKRDAALAALSELVAIKVFERTDGDAVVFTTGGTVLVDNNATRLTHEQATAVAPMSTHAAGSFEAIFAGRESEGRDITGTLRGGRLAGLIEMRDEILTDLQSSLDEAASQLRDVVNQIHNRGVPVPGLGEMTGSRRFSEPNTQTIQFANDGDVAIVVLDNNGDQAAATTLRTIIEDPAIGGGALVATDPLSITAIAEKIGGWLDQSDVTGDASAEIDADGHLSIRINAPGLHLAFRDEDTNGAAADVSIAFDADGTPPAEETVDGFSFFFGLNDFFTDERTSGTLVSDVLNPNQRVGATTLTFRDAGGPLPAVNIAADSSLDDVVSAINLQTTNLRAFLVPDGAGQRLQIVSSTGADLVVSDGGAGFVDALGLSRSEIGVSGSLSVRDDIVAAPNRVTRGALQFDENRGVNGEYAIGAGDAKVARQLAEALSTGRPFETAGRMGIATRTFDQYAGAILADVASDADRNAGRAASGAALVESLQARANQTSGVSLDEEMSNLILYEHSYAASARVLAAIKDMFDLLEQTVI